MTPLPYIPADVSAVMMCGVSGSGKTTMARRLEAEGWVRLSPDALTYDTGLSYPEAMARTLDRLRPLLDAGRRVVIDAAMCKRTGRDALRRICRDAGVRCGLIYLSAPREELLRRLTARAGSGPDDIIVPAADLDRFLQNFQPPEPDEPQLIDKPN